MESDSSWSNWSSSWSWYLLRYHGKGRRWQCADWNLKKTPFLASSQLPLFLSLCYLMEVLYCHLLASLITTGKKIENVWEIVCISSHLSLCLWQGSSPPADLRVYFWSFPNQGRKCARKHMLWFWPQCPVQLPITVRDKKSRIFSLHSDRVAAMSCLMHNKML